MRRQCKNWRSGCSDHRAGKTELSECRVVRNGVKITGLGLERSCRAPRGMCCSGFLLFLALWVPLKWQWHLESLHEWHHPCALGKLHSALTCCLPRRKPGGPGEAKIRCHSGELIPGSCLSGTAGIWEPWEWCSHPHGVFRVLRGVNVLSGPFLPSLLFYPSAG